MFQAKTWTRICQTKWIRTGADRVSLFQDITRISNVVQCHFLAVNHSPQYRDLSICQVLSTVPQISSPCLIWRENWSNHFFDTVAPHPFGRAVSGVRDQSLISRYKLFLFADVFTHFLVLFSEAIADPALLRRRRSILVIFLSLLPIY